MLPIRYFEGKYCTFYSGYLADNFSYQLTPKPFQNSYGIQINVLLFVNRTLTTSELQSKEEY